MPTQAYSYHAGSASAELLSPYLFTLFLNADLVAVVYITFEKSFKLTEVEGKTFRAMPSSVDVKNRSTQHVFGKHYGQLRPVRPNHGLN